MTEYTPRSETFVGTSCSGTDGTANRTLTLSETPVRQGMTLAVNNAYLHYGSTKDYTLSGAVITFKNAMFDTDTIDVVYFVSSAGTSSTTTLKYTTQLAFNQFLESEKKVPNREQTLYPAIEVVGAVSSTTDKYYLDQANIIQDTIELRYGASESASTALTFGTHYDLDEDEGKIDLTPSGSTAIGTRNLYAKYSYNKLNITNTRITNLLASAEALVDAMVNSCFYDSTDATPSFGQVINEYHIGQGAYNKVYQTDKYPLDDSTTTLNGAVSAGDTTIIVTSTNGFPDSGYIGIETDKVLYTGKTGTSFTGCSGVASAHTTGKTVTNYVIEQSLDSEGSEPSWEVLLPDTGYNIDFKSGEVILVDDSVLGTTIIDNFHPAKRVFNRVRFTYNYGYDSIPSDVVKLVHLMAARELYSAQVLNAVARGTNGFSSEAIGDIDREIAMLVNKYKAWLIKDTK